MRGGGGIFRGITNPRGQGEGDKERRKMWRRSQNCQGRESPVKAWKKKPLGKLTPRRAGGGKIEKGGEKEGSRRAGLGRTAPRQKGDGAEPQCVLPSEQSGRMFSRSGRQKKGKVFRGNFGITPKEGGAGEDRTGELKRIKVQVGS